MGLIRFLLACGVVLYHSAAIMGYMPLSSNLAVQVFYIISGFYMAMVLTEKYTGKGSSYLFYTNRALKIYPVYLVILVLLVILSAFLYKYHYPGTLDYFTIYGHPSIFTIIYVVVVNIFIFGLETLFLLGLNQHGNLYFTKNFNNTSPAVYNFAFNAISWTVGVELIFYIIAPWLTRRKFLILLIILISSLGLRIYLGNLFGDIPPWNYMFFPTQLMFFVLGIFSYRLYKVLTKYPLKKGLLYFAFFLFVAITLFYYQVFPESHLKNIILFISVSLLIPFTFELTKRSKIDRFFGNISYPIYISQAFVIRFTIADRFPKILDKGFTSLVAVIITGILLDVLISKPIEKIREKRILIGNHRRPDSSN